VYDVVADHVSVLVGRCAAKSAMDIPPLARADAAAAAVAADAAACA